MILKDYQVRCLKQVKNYLNVLYKYKEKYLKYLELDYDLAKDYNFCKKAWDECKISNLKGEIIDYNSKYTGIGTPLPNICLKIPTGGGKTFLATKSIDLINSIYMNKKTGFVLWIVPTDQIYKQTFKALKDREHPYRQSLDLSSGGKTLILKKTDRFTKDDIENNLVIMLLMLPSANRKNKETLKIFRDSGAFDSFFPSDENFKMHEELLKEHPNLDYFENEYGFRNKQVKTSLGNTLKILKPIIIIDEGQKAYSKGAQDTIRGFNPSIILELSATPPEGSNPLVSISGKELNAEEMIKLDMHVINKSTTEWRDVLTDSVNKRNFLEEQSIQYKSETGKYIRPINLIQVERTGKNQVDSGYIHSEHVKEYLIRYCGISENEIAIKSSDKDDIEGIDLLSEDCEIRYIITKQALQEGWDCPFAYVLTVLTDTKAEMNITQLVGRILRQPYAEKTSKLELNESYVYCFRENSNEVLKSIKKSLESEGLGDMKSKIISNSTDTVNSYIRNIEYREKFKQYKGKIYLPRFLFNDNSNFREVSYEMDILSRINWNDIKFDKINQLVLSENQKKDIVIDIALSDDYSSLTNQKIMSMNDTNNSDIDYLFVARNISRHIPNPWIAYEIATKALDILLSKYNANIISSNLVFIIEELNKMIESQKDELAQYIFYELISNKTIQFFLQREYAFILPTSNTIKGNSTYLNKLNGMPLEKSLFEFVVEDDLNNLEKSIAVCIDEQEKLLWWYRNIAKKDYHIQGWKKFKIYPDFIFAKLENEDFATVHILETKGVHLKNDDTKYKTNVFELCNELVEKMDWDELEEEFFNNQIEFKVVYDIEWKQKINEIFAATNVAL